MSSLTLMSKGEKGVEFEKFQEQSPVWLDECRGVLSLNESVAINAKGGDCWQILNKQQMRVDGCCH